MKKTLLVVLTLIITATVANAASLHGEYEGNPIVKVTTGGKELTVEDVPAISYNGRTLVPIGMLRQLGVDVTWNSDTYSVNVEIPQIEAQEPESNPYNDIAWLNRELTSSGIDFVQFTSGSSGFLELSFFYNGSLDSLFGKADLFDDLLSISALSDSNSTRIADKYDNEFTVLTDYVREFKSGKLTADELVSKYKIKYSTTSNTSPTVPNLMTDQNGTVGTTETFDNTNVCQEITDDYAYRMVMVGYENLTMGQIKNERLKLEYARDKELTANGCSIPQ